MPDTSHYAAKAILSSVLQQAAMPTLTGLWLGIFTAAPHISGTPTNEFSATGTDYARIDVLSLMSPVSSNGGSVLTTQIDFLPATAFLGDPLWWALLDAETVGTGNWWFRGENPDPRTIDVDDVLSFLGSAISLQVR